MKKLLLAGALALAVFAGCGNDAQPDTRDKGNAKALINMPDKFPTVAVKCYEGSGIYVTSVNNTSLAVVPNDPVCKN